MKQKKLTILTVASGVVCALCVLAFMGMVQGEANAARAEALARYGGEQIEVCVATRDIAAGERVDSGAVESKLWVADLLPEGTVRNSSDIVGRTAASSILKGEVFSEQRFQVDREKLSVPEGKTAVSVPAKTVQAVGGAIGPGMKVALYAAGESGARVIAQDIVVLATSADESSSSLSDAAWITVAVEPEQVQELVTASIKYELYFVLPGMVPESTQKSTANARSGTKGRAQSSENATSSDNVETGNNVAAGSNAETADVFDAVDASALPANQEGAYE